jgi:hypothetical protein
VLFTPDTGTFTLLFDGSDIGLTTEDEDIDAIALDGEGRLILSTLGPMSAGGISGEDEDLFLFADTALGASTAGALERLFDGSGLGLTLAGEDLDGAARLASGEWIFSTTGDFAVEGLSGGDGDLFRFDGGFAPELPASALGLSGPADIGALEVR